MTFYELFYLLLFPFTAAIYQKVQRLLAKAIKSYSHPAEILDVGGRKSSYTMGLPAHVTILDLPKESEIQQELNLGLDPDDLQQIDIRRSNIRQVVLEDFTQTQLPEASLDCVVSVEVLEHVEENDLFVQQIRRVLKPDGVFLMTTPNADHPTRQGPTPPGNARYYTREMLATLLSRHFESVEIEYAIPVGKWFSYGHKSWSLRQPRQTFLSMLGNLITTFRDARPDVRHQAVGTRHLFATAYKSNLAQGSMRK